MALGLIGALVLLGFLAHSGGQSGMLAVIIVVGVLFALALIPAAIVVGIVFTLATRSVVLELRGPVAALRRGLHLLGARLGRALLVWLIQVGLSIGVGFAALLVFDTAALVLGALTHGPGVASGGAVASAVAVPMGLVFLALLIVVGGVTGSYFSTYWTLAFRRMELDLPPPAPHWPPPPATHPS